MHSQRHLRLPKNAAQGGYKIKEKTDATPNSHACISVEPDESVLYISQY